MHQEAASTFKIVIAVVVLSLSLISCAEMEIKDPPQKEPVTKVFSASYEKVWRAVQLATRRYPIRVNIYDAGVLETEYVKGDRVFSDPNDIKSPTGQRYRLIVHAVKGTVDKQNMIKVIVQKQLETQSDFFTGFRPADSNGLEERVILYRISRYINIGSG
jgi:hypothetical protein